MEQYKKDILNILNDLKYQIIDIDKYINRDDYYASIDELYKKIQNNIWDLPNERGIYFVCLKNAFDFDIKSDMKGNKKSKWYLKDELEKKRDELKKINSYKSILYIGKASGEKNRLRQRIKQYINYGKFNGNNHAGGRAIWQIEANNIDKKLIFFWLPIEDKEFVKKIEKDLINIYKKTHNNNYPFANRKNGG